MVPCKRIAHLRSAAQNLSGPSKCVSQMEKRALFCFLLGSRKAADSCFVLPDDRSAKKKGNGARIAKLAVFSQAVPMTSFPKICHGADHSSSSGNLPVLP